MAHYSSERKASILKKLLPPQNMSIPKLASEEGISTQTLYNWRNQAKQSGLPVPGKTKSSDDWSSDTKLAVVIETASLSESKLSEYCREKGLYPNQVKQWKRDCLSGFQRSDEQNKQIKQQAKAAQSEIKHLKKDLRRKEKALAETTALLVLRKKLHALLGDESEEG